MKERERLNTHRMIERTAYQLLSCGRGTWSVTWEQTQTNWNMEVKDGQFLEDDLHQLRSAMSALKAAADAKSVSSSSSYGALAFTLYQHICLSPYKQPPRVVPTTFLLFTITQASIGAGADEGDADLRAALQQKLAK
eukprot:2728695-Amphidinium_carterae.1